MTPQQRMVLATEETLRAQREREPDTHVHIHRTSQPIVVPPIVVPAPVVNVSSAPARVTVQSAPASVTVMPATLEPSIVVESPTAGAVAEGVRSALETLAAQKRSTRVTERDREGRITALETRVKE